MGRRHSYETPYTNGAFRPSLTGQAKKKVYCEDEEPFFCWLLGDSPADGHDVYARNLQEAGQRFASSEMRRTNNTVYIRVRGHRGVYAVEPGGGTTRCAW